MGKLNVIAEPGTQEIIMTRTFDAPRELLFKVYNDPNLIPKWFGPKELTTVVDKMELKPGGQFRFVQRNAEGNEFAFHGVFHSIEAAERVVSTFEFEGMPGHVLLSIVTYTEQDGKSLFSEKMIFESVEARDGMLQSGMEGGAAESMDRVEELLMQAVS